MIMLSRVILLTLSLSLLPTLAVADQSVPQQKVAEKTPKTKTQVIEKTAQVEPGLKKTGSNQPKEKPKSEAEILQSLDNLNQQLNNEIFSVEAQNSLVKDLDKTELYAAENPDVKLSLGKDMLPDDGFGELDLGEILINNALNQLNNALDSELIKGMPRTGKAAVKYGVGISAKEAVLINILDNSDLMDFENEIEIQSQKVVDDQDE